MSAHGLTPEALKQQHRTEIVEIGTFRPHGVTELEALDYLETQEGKKYLQHLRNAAPDAPKEIIAARAMDQITSGREIPRMEAINEPLVKIIPAGLLRSEERREGKAGVSQGRSQWSTTH